MLETWIAAIPAMIVALVVMYVPGLALNFAIGLRHYWLVGLAPAVSIALWGITSVALPLAGVSWSPLAAVCGVFLTAVLIFAVFRWVLRARFTPDSRPVPWVIPVFGWVTPALVIFGIALFGIRDASAIAQLPDTIFHLNGVQYILDGQNASPFYLGTLPEATATSQFYPGGWHILTALTVQIASTSIPVAANAVSIVAAACVWPASMLLLTRTILGERTIGLVSAGLLSSTFAIAPLFLLNFGVLYPFLLALVTAPAALALMLNAFQLSRGRRIARMPSIVVLSIGAFGGVALAHPSLVVLCMIMVIPVSVIAACNGWKLRSPAQNWSRIALAIVCCGLIVFAIIRLNTLGDWWGTRTGVLRAVSHVFLLRILGDGLPILTAALMVLGLIRAAAMRSVRSLALLSIWGVVAVLYVITLAIDHPALRWITFLWYGDSVRIAAILVIVVIPFVALGIDWVARFISSRRRLTQWTAMAAVFAVFAIGLVTADMPKLYREFRIVYTLDDDSILLTTDEYALLERLDDHVPADEKVIGNPWTGTAMAYAIADREAEMPHIFFELNEDGTILEEELRNAASNPKVCAAAERENVWWVLDFGDQELLSLDHEYPGLDRIDTAEGFTLVDAEGDAKLYRLTACG